MQALTRSVAIAIGSGCGLARRGRHHAARRERTARQRIHRAGDRPGERGELAVPSGFQSQPGAQQSVSVGMGGPAENLCGRTDFGDAAGVEHGDPIRDLRGYPEVVGDQYDAAADFGAQPLKQSQNLGLHGDIESSRRFVGDDQLGVACDRDGDHHPLPQSTGQLVRERPEPSLGFRDADSGEQLERLLVAACRFGYLLADPHGRVQRRHRVLKDGAEVKAAHLAQYLRVAGHHVVARHCHRALHPGLRQQPEHGEPEDALAGPRFADQTENLAGRDVEGHAAQCAHITAIAAERDVQVGDRGHQRSIGCRAGRLCVDLRYCATHPRSLTPPACHLTVFMACRSGGYRWRNQSGTPRNRFVSGVSVV
jgi:hypothetical protein